MLLLLTVLVCAAQDPVVLRTAEAPDPAAFPALALPEGEVGIVLGASPESAEMLAAAGFAVAPFVRGKVAVVSDPRAPRAAGVETVVWVSALTREQTAAVLRETAGISLCIVSGRGGGDVEPLRIGETWMIQAPGGSALWGRAEWRAGSVTYRLEAPAGKPSDAVAAAKRKLGVPVDALKELREGAKKDAGAAPPGTAEAANRACRVRIHGVSERASYGAKVPPPGKRLLVVDAEFENIIPLTLVQSNQVPTIYKVKDLGDHLYLVVNGMKASRLYPDAGTLPGHVGTVGFALDRLGSRLRGNLVYEIPEAPVRMDLRFYDYAHGHFSILLRAGEVPEAKPVTPPKENDILEAGIFGVQRPADKAAPPGMAYLAVDLRARSRMVTESDATAFDPKAKPGDKIPVGTVSDWTDLRKHLNVLVDGTRSVGPADVADLGEAPRFLPDVLTGGRVWFLVPEKAESLDLRCDFPNARLPSGQVVHPAALAFPLEGKRPEAPLPAALLEIDDDVFKVAVVGQRVGDLPGVKPPPNAKLLVLDVVVRGNGKAGEQFQTAEQLRYATEKGAQLAPHEASWQGPRAASKLLLVPPGELRRFDLVFAIPAGEQRPRLAYRGVSKAEVLALPSLEGGAADAPARKLCPKCKAEAGPNDKFCAECGTRFDGK